MRRIFIWITFLGLLSACGGDETPAGKAAEQSSTDLKSDKTSKMRLISDLEAAVKEDESGEDIKLRQQLLVAYSDFVNFHNTEEMAPEFLFRAAKLANEIGKPRRAIEYLVNLHDGFPRYERRTEAVFLIGFIYENVLNDRPMAEMYYEQVVELYPESSWAEDARLSLKLLYLTDDEKIQIFLKQNEAAQ